jgi:UDP-N-acetylmuramoyl-tripeptide--D-alanyl-D-alanine ligase
MTIIKKIIIFILTLESRLILAKYKPFIIAVTGSVGKTTTKDAIFCVLKDFVPSDASQVGLIRKSEKSLNSEIGLPLTVIGVPNSWRNPYGWTKNMLSGLRLILDHADYPKCLVLEIGADHPGDIKKVVKWLHPNIAVITKVSDTPVHVEFFKSPAQVFEEKASLADGLKDGGTLILFADDAKVVSIADRVKGKDIKVMTFGLTEMATVRGSQETISYESSQFSSPNSQFPTGFSFKLDMDGNSVPISIKNVVGKTYIYPLLAAAAVAKARGMSVNSIVNALNAYEAPKGRMNIIPGINSSTLIDDTYNSSPDAVRAALETLKSITTSGRKIAILGDMMELGKYSADEHRAIGREAAGAASILITIGLRSRAMAEEAIKNGMLTSNVQSFESSDEAAVAVPSFIQSGDIVLIKGSQSPRLERVTKALMREPEKAGELLVRQEKEWLEKK